KVVLSTALRNASLGSTCFFVTSSISASFSETMPTERPTCIIDQFPSDRQAQIRVMLSESLRGVIAQTLCKKIGGGRAAALEVLIVTPAMSNLIREAKTFQIPSMMQVGKAVGMVSLNDALFDY